MKSKVVVAMIFSWISITFDEVNADWSTIPLNSSAEFIDTNSNADIQILCDMTTVSTVK